MKKCNKFCLFAIWSLFIICNLTLGNCNLPLYAQDKIIAIVNKDIITQKDLNDFINFMRMQLSTEYKGAELESKIQSMKVDLMDKLIEDRLILQEAKKNNIRIEPYRIKARVDDIKRHYGSDSEFQRALAKQGLVQADVEVKIREQSLMFSVIDREIRSKITINPGEVTDFYQENIKQFMLPEQRSFESLSIESGNFADEVFNKLKEGAKLQDIAKTYSLVIDKLTASRSGQLRRDVEEALFKMGVGEISRPVNIEHTYYIFQLNSIAPPRQQTLSEVQEEIHTMLFNMKMQDALTKWLVVLREHSYIKILQD